jgi:hypothetical protein
MDSRKFGLSIFVGLAFGGLLGMAIGALRGNPANGFWFGALLGVFVGWFVAAIRARTTK